MRDHLLLASAFPSLSWICLQHDTRLRTGIGLCLGHYLYLLEHQTDHEFRLGSPTPSIGFGMALALFFLLLKRHTYSQTNTLLPRALGLPVHSPHFARLRPWPRASTLPVSWALSMAVVNSYAPRLSPKLSGGGWWEREEDEVMTRPHLPRAVMMGKGVDEAGGRQWEEVNLMGSGGQKVMPLWRTLGALRAPARMVAFAAHGTRAP